jgi:hypothetical protein
MSTHRRHAYEPDEPDTDRPSFARVESFLASIDERRRAARRTRLTMCAVATAIGAVATLTALGVVPVEAEEVALSATAVVAGFVLTRE